MSRSLDLTRDGLDWPHRHASRIVEAGRMRFHVQMLGAGPPLLMLHGTGASTHSFRDLAKPLAERFTVVMVDLPGHGFSSHPRGEPPSMAVMSRLIGALLQKLEIVPAYAVGHSAGAAVLIRMALDGRIAPRQIVSLNGALLPFPGLAAQLFPQLARILFLNPLAPRFFSWRARTGGAVARLMESTGSHITPEGLAYYERLLASSSHVAGALKMMANWDLESLRRDLPKLTVPLTLMVGTRDRAIPPEVSHQVARMVPNADVVTLPGFGHLAHEEAPQKVAAAIIAAIERSRQTGQAG